mmetsp:Transcript_10586/g.17775  ORF Transcript_10586/g.17775 Transcript_10586/m.17775 type:complete len:161 (+) Transcript_10586:27-509(+)
MSKKIALMVAEKPSVAKSICEFLARGQQMRKFQGKSKYNPIYEFDYPMKVQSNQIFTLRVTSVLGHIMGLKYPDSCKDWNRTNIEDLFHIQMEKNPIDSSKQVVKSLQFYSKDIDSLVLWLDCDREGEAIAFDIIDVCRESVRRNAQLDIYRAHFSALTY